MLPVSNLETEIEKEEFRYFIGRRVPIKANWKLFIAVKVFKWLGVADIEGMGECKTRELAIKIASMIDGGFYIKVPTIKHGDEGLGLEPTYYGPHEFPNSKYKDDYSKIKFKNITVSKHILLKLVNSLDDVLKLR